MINLRKPLIIATIYLVIVSGVTIIQYESEKSKIRRGNFSDTLSPFFYTHILTFPSSVLFRDWRGYPANFNSRTYESTLNAALPRVFVNEVIEALLILIVIAAAASLRARRSTRQRT